VRFQQSGSALMSATRTKLRLIPRPTATSQLAQTAFGEVADNASYQAADEGASLDDVTATFSGVMSQKAAIVNF
jgi:hypothetical protein